MSNRPPATYKRRYVDTSGATNADGRTPWPQASGSPTTLTGIANLGPGLSLLGILFEGSGTFVSTPSATPSGVTAATLSQQIPAAMWVDDVPVSIDPSTTALPLVLYWGPLGVGAR